MNRIGISGSRHLVALSLLQCLRRSTRTLLRSGSGDSPPIGNYDQAAGTVPQLAAGTVPMWSSPCGPFQRRAVMGSGDSPHVVGRRGQVPEWAISTPAAGTVPVWAFSVGIPGGSFNGRRIAAFPPKTTCPNAASDGRSSHGRFAADHRVRTR